MKPILALACALLLLCAPAAHAAVDQEATFQDDNLLVYGTPDKVAETMDELKRLGVDRLRISVFWAVVAPKDRPADPSDPAQYPNGSWDRYDTIVRLARRRGLGVNFNITTPAPSWATGDPERADIKETYLPDASEWGRFVKAVGTRYDGAHGPGRVDYWSLMNEPNQPGWLTPQWKKVGDDFVEAAPRLYRDMVRTGWQALQDTGHGSDTILVGELAPKGRKSTKGLTIAMDPLRFIRRLYCLDDNLQVLEGDAAEQQGCPSRDQIAGFPAQNPGLFQMTGWSHHPYELLFAPDRRQSWPDWVTTANLDDLQSVLGRIRARYGQSDLRVPLYLTEFGYQTNPPDRIAVTPAQQAQYLNHAEFISYRRRDVRTLTQFLLLDDGDPISRTFQSGLRFRDGRAKPAYRAYQVPIHLPTTKLRRGQRLRVWGGARAPEAGTRPAIEVEFRAARKKTWRRIATLRGDRERGYVDTSVRSPGTGSVRLRSGRRTSRSVAVTVSARRR